MSKPVDLQRPISDAQRRFIDATASLGAISPTTARSSHELPRLTGRELVQLLDAGIVREATPGSFYAEPAVRTVRLPDQPTYGLIVSGAALARARRIKLIIIAVLLAVVIGYTLVSGGFS
jgi:hypothetical protein